MPSVIAPSHSTQAITMTLLAQLLILVLCILSNPLPSHLYNGRNHFVPLFIRH